jgi:hypothetical protein
MLGYPGQLALRAQAQAGEIISPTLYLAGPSFWCVNLVKLELGPWIAEYVHLPGAHGRSSYLPMRAVDGFR